MEETWVCVGLQRLRNERHVCASRRDL
ncbi:MAG: hypothetical protein IT364_12295 [Candidatus Hydrogenedentes bacterium]|nr:hypothetical protein [Candidatus Hydrogenedentota bacterium]